MHDTLQELQRLSTARREIAQRYCDLVRESAEQLGMCSEVALFKKAQEWMPLVGAVAPDSVPPKLDLVRMLAAVAEVRIEHVTLAPILSLSLAERHIANLERRASEEYEFWRNQFIALRNDVAVS